MRLPISYPLRNMVRRPLRSIMTVFGIAIVVFACVLMLALNRGIQVRANLSGEENNLLVYSKRGSNILFSQIEGEEINHLINLPDLAVGTSGEPLVSPELMLVSKIRSVNGTAKVKTSINIRGVTSLGYEVHRSVKVKEGRLPEGQWELLAGATAFVKLNTPKEEVKVGSKILFENHDWTIVGLFEAGGSVFESEMWCSQDDLMAIMRRRTSSFAVCRFDSKEIMERALPQFSQSGGMEKYFKGLPEKKYYSDLAKTLDWLFWLSVFMVAAISLAGALIGVNTMYTAIAHRISEIASLKVFGFRNSEILTSLLIESTILACIGGAIGLLAGSFLDSLTFAMAQGAFMLEVDPYVIGAGAALSVLIGLLGGLFPAIKGIRMSIVEGLSAE